MNPIEASQLTAYALGELAPAARRQIEEQLRAEPALAARVAEIRAFAARLETELAGEPDIALTPAQRQAVLAAPARPAGRLRFAALRKYAGLAAVAAAITLLFGGAFWAATRNLHGTLLAQVEEKGEMAVERFEDQPLEELSEYISPLEALPDLVDVMTPPHVDLDMTAPPPDIQDFAAAPKEEGRMRVMHAAPPSEPRIAMSMPIDSRRGPESPVIMRSLASGSMANRASHSPAPGIYRAGGRWEAEIPADNDSYSPIQGNAFKRVLEEPLSTFSIDVDTASYANVRRFLKAGRLPPPDAVRIEEMINYFPYEYAPPRNDEPFAVHVESAACPWNPAHTLVRIALKGRELDAASRPPCNLVFLVDVSGSMSSENRLPLVKKSLQLLARQLADRDRISIVTYAGGTRVVLPPTPASDLTAIDAALGGLWAGGSTAGGAGIRLAYDEALKSLLPDGNNRVILCTDGDFNVGITDSDELAAFIAERARTGIFLTILGFGMGNYKDDRLETLSNKGNGNYAYIDSFSEARKTLVEQAAGTLFAIAKDVKLQIEFNPARFAAYRLVGYENRLLAKEDFNNDKKDAGELGAGHTVTAFYELVPHGIEAAPGVDPLKYQPQPEPAAALEPPPLPDNPEWLTVKLRYKPPREDRSRKLEVPFTGADAAFEHASADFRFAAGVAAAGYRLRGDTATADLAFADIAAWIAAATGPDPDGYRREFLDLLKNAAALAR